MKQSQKSLMMYMRRQLVGKPDLSIIILVFNAKNYVEKCIQSIKESKVNFIFEVIIVDNLSTDGSKELIKQLAKNNTKIKTVWNTKNSGFSAGNNLGVKRAVGRYILFLNPDTVLSRHALQNTFDYMEDNLDVGVVGAKLCLEIGELDSASHRGFPTPWNAICQLTGIRSMFPKSHLFAGYTQGWNLENSQAHEVDAISGAFFFTRRSLGESLGWWDEDYFMYGEDIDFCFRVKTAGWKVVFLPKADVLHYGGVSAGIRKHVRKLSLASKETRLRAARASTSAMRIFYKKHYSDKYPTFITEIVLAGVGVLEKFRLLRITLT